MMGSCFSCHKSGGEPSQVDREISAIIKVKIYKYKEIRQATDDFDALNKIGEGGFGSVYKGRLKDGKIAAIKVLSAESRQGVKEFLTEINVISEIQHENLVKLYGCCVEGNHRILVYNYLENNSLDKTLLAGGYIKSGIQFDWRTRSRICIGVAKGLAFLHEEVRPHIIHRDIKASNILLDRDLSPKIADFGLAKLMPPNMTHVSTRVAGTIGYLAPEYAVRGQVTRKADVYSYGVLLMEIVSARSNKNTRLPQGYQYLLERAWDLYERNELVDLVDTGLNGVFDGEEACRYLKIGLLCTQDNPKLRPSMSTVVKLLTGEKKDIESRNITRPGLISDFMDLKVKGPVEKKQEEVNRRNYYTNLSSDNASSSTGTRDNSNAYSSGASSSTALDGYIRYGSHHTRNVEPEKFRDLSRFGLVVVVVVMAPKSTERALNFRKQQRRLLFLSIARTCKNLRSDHKDRDPQRMPANTYLEQQANVHALSGLKIENSTVEKAPLASNDSVSTSDMLKLKRVHAKACQYKPCPADDASKAKYMTVARRLEQMLFKMAISKDDYLNQSTLVSRLATLMTRRIMNNQQNANSSPPGTMTTLAPEVSPMQVGVKVPESEDELETEIAESLKSMSLYS
uniref:Protein kinase domain-containing protein n=1 Tax=Brassica campestris TaxID=3711 RepID=A0A3P6C9X0_BRACM|nr:unnamed protein product [Brassica rapa]